MTEQAELKQVNIKKKKTRSLYFGVAVDTGELLPIESVPKGLACKCICPSCGTSLVAHKGEYLTHHFAHERNNECYYGAELSVYRAFYDYLRRNLQFSLPDAVLKFNSYKKPEVVRKGYLQKLTDVELIIDPGKYPPILVCAVGENKFQLVLNIESYYSESDFQRLATSGEKAQIAVVVVDIDNIDAITSMNDLSEYVLGSKCKTWVYNRLVNDWDQKYRKAAVKAEQFGSGYLCPAQKNQFNNIYSSRWEDCAHCQYCYSCKDEVLCLGDQQISHVEDFKKSSKERKREFEIANHIKPIKKIHEYSCPQCGAPMRRKTSANGIFAGCSRFPDCKGSRQVEQHTEQVIIYADKKRYY